LISSFTNLNLIKQIICIRGEKMNFGMTEILIILAIILILFGGKQIPNLAKSLGSSIHSFKKGIQDAGKSKDTGSDKL